MQMLLSALPGGSITGAPKIRAIQIIEELEGASRGVRLLWVWVISILMERDAGIS